MPDAHEQMPNNHATNGEDDFSFVRLMTISLGARLMVDASFQIFSPFLPVIAQGLNISVVTLGRLVSLRSLMGLLSPVFGSMADRSGYRRVLRFALWVGALGLLLIGLSTNLWMAAVGMVLSGIGMSGFTPTLQAYISGRLPYDQRARGIGVLEYSWAITGIVSLFLIGWLIAATSWRAPFILLAAGMAIMGFVFSMLPSARRKEGTPALPAGTEVASWPERAAGFFKLQSNARSAYADMAVGSLSFFAGMQVMITYGAWLANEYGLGPTQLGVVAVVFGLFDLAASISVSLFTDRLGKRRSVIFGVAGSLLGYLLLPFFNTTLLLAVLGIALARGSFEFGVVSNFSLLSEQVPAQRGKVMTLSAAIGLLGATVASWTGPALYTSYGVPGLAAVSAAVTVVALVILLVWVRDGSGEEME
jgi:predicted MFS family arabinose efflux permease